ncbi:D site albumin promoter binding protein b isoform X2 [Clupea harengus]|uniref:D site albumin promoter binding protein b isoform X2 n=1 Tax=Clupea harengus TaxID=7950 RepID=A0A6P3VNY0_CLUHA|nr:D site albumin promoter binding protein b isoform X2 [Clupea harengus]
MSRPISQLLPPDLHHAGASPQFGNSNQSSYPLSGGHLNPAANLKSLLQLPMKGDQQRSKDTEMKDKKTILDLDEDSTGRHSMRSSSSSSGGSSSSNNNSGGEGNNSNSSSGSGSFSNSTFTGPMMWERTLPVDGGLFQLQYMDLEEFLTENGMGQMHSTSGCSSAAQVPSHSSQSAVPNQSSQCPTTSPLPCSSASSSCSSSSASSSPTLIGLEVQAPPNLMGVPDCLHGGHTAALDPNQSPSPTSCAPMDTPPETDGDSEMGDMSEMGNYDTEASDLALSTVPGQESFDPRGHRFNDDELKPQPMIKKARKMMVPEDLKDDKYWSRRHKNNEAAKRSRDARRLKENQISVRASFLERENAALRQEVADMRKELGRCRNLLNKYESRHGDQ